MQTPPHAPAIQPAVVDWPPPPGSKWEREYWAFGQLLPRLMDTHRGQYVAIHEEQVLDCDANEMALILGVLGQVGNVDIHVGFVGDQPGPVFRSGVLRELSPRVDA